jgi:hypothetical protein
MKDLLDIWIRKDARQGAQIVERQGVQDNVAFDGRELNQTYAFPVRVQTVGLGVDRDDSLPGQLTRQQFERLRRGNQLRKAGWINAHRTRLYRPLLFHYDGSFPVVVVALPHLNPLIPFQVIQADRASVGGPHG